MSLRALLLAAWTLTLGLLVWAASGSRVAPATAWDATTFPTALTGTGRAMAREGGYATPGSIVLDHGWAARPLPQDCGSEAVQATERAYVDLGR